MAGISRKAVLVACGLTLFVMLATAPAGAHGTTGKLTVTAQPGFEAGTIDVRAKLVFANDDDPVTEGATVTVVASDAAGVARQPVSMTTGGGGIYAALLRLPEGTWKLHVTAVNPAAEAETTAQSLAASAATTAPTRPPGPASAAQADADADGGGHTGHLVIFGSIAVLAVLGAAAALAVTRRERRARLDRLSGRDGPAT